jgi:hypothetical protein
LGCQRLGVAAMSEDNICNVASVQVLQSLEQQQPHPAKQQEQQDESTAAAAESATARTSGSSSQQEPATSEHVHSAPDELYAQLVQLRLLRR